jgi:hypothetical protein
MITRSTVRSIGTAVLGTGVLVAATLVCANPVLTSPAAQEAPPAVQDEQQITQHRPATTPPLPAAAPVELPVTIDEPVLLANFTAPPPRPSSAPSPRRNAVAAEIDLQLRQILRRLSELFADPAGAPVHGRGRTGWEGVLEFGRGEVYFFGFGSAMARDPLASAPQLSPASFPAPSYGYEEFTYAPIGGRRSLSSDLPQPAYAEAYAAPAPSDYTSARAAGAASAQWEPSTQGAGSAAHLAPFIDTFREVLTDPVTLMVAFGWLMLWLFLETVQWGPSRRRRR